MQLGDGAARSRDVTWLTMADGQRLFLRDWPSLQARGAVLIVHGLGEHSGRYGQLAAWFNQRGYAVRSYDQRGHGQTPGQRSALRHGDDLLEDLATVYTDYANGLPHAPLLLGHSMGGLVAARTVLDGRIAPPRRHGTHDQHEGQHGRHEGSGCDEHGGQRHPHHERPVAAGEREHDGDEHGERERSDRERRPRRLHDALTGAQKRYPAPGSVSIQRGCWASSPSARRSSAIR